MTCATLAVVFLALGAQRPAIGSQAPPVSARDLQGVERTLQSLGGPRGLVVFFWATWSERSLEELKRIEGAQEEIRSHGVGIVALNVDHETLSAADLETVRTKVSAVGVTMPVLIDEGLKAFHAYCVVTVPSTALIDGEGKLAGFFPGYAHEQREALFDALDELAGIAPAGRARWLVSKTARAEASCARRARCTNRGPRARAQALARTRGARQDPGRGPKKLSGAATARLVDEKLWMRDRGVAERMSRSLFGVPRTRKKTASSAE